LKENEISLFGRISSIVDIYDALTTERSYKKALSPFEALSFLNKTREDYDRECLTRFIMTLGKQIKEEATRRE
jgi:HD-GYP domain-containing protein (c-di-GMP phosphodiesterase class II)